MKKIFIDISIKSIKSYENPKLILVSYVQLRVPREFWTCIVYYTVSRSTTLSPSILLYRTVHVFFNAAKVDW